jgi:hypothetical protein
VLNHTSADAAPLSGHRPQAGAPDWPAASVDVNFGTMGIGWSVHRNGGWVGRLERSRRWQERLLNAATDPNGDDDDLLDFLYAFFQNCWHLHEWVDQTSNIPKDTLKSLASCEEMLICRDIANGTKHLTLKRKPGFDGEFSILREFAPDLPRQQRWILIAQDKKYDLIALAAACLSGWQTLLQGATLLDANPFAPSG